MSSLFSKTKPGLLGGFLAFFQLCLPHSQAWAMTVPAVFSGVDVVHGAQTSLAIRESAQATVVLFLSARCPCSASHEQTIGELYTEFSGKGFRFLGVHSNADEPMEMTREHFAGTQLPFPVIQDAEAKLADQLGALKTPHVFVVSPQGKVLFQGGVDDSHIAQTARQPHLRNALAAISVGAAPPRTDVRSMGCAIKRP